MDPLALVIKTAVSEVLEGDMIEKRTFLAVVDQLYHDAWLIVKYQKVLRILKPGQLAGMSSMLREVVEVLEQLAGGVEEECESSSTPIDISHYVEDVGEQNDKPHP
jgi:hypothetical protein